MSNYPNMSYCMFENTAAAMAQVLEGMKEADDIELLDLDQYERQGFESLYRQCQVYIKQYERLAEEFA